MQTDVTTCTFPPGGHMWQSACSDKTTSWIDTIQDFLRKLGMKPRVHLVEISIFHWIMSSLGFTKIMNNLLKHLKILIFKVIFQSGKLIESFQFFFFDKYWNLRPNFNKKKCFWKFWFLKYSPSQSSPTILVYQVGLISF